MNAYEALGRDLQLALRTQMGQRAHARRVAAVSTVSAVLVGILSSAALASGMLPGLDLDPTKWEVLGRGDVDGRASYVNARDRQSGERSTFLEERDAGMDRYEAFLLHRKTKQAAGLPLAPGAVCTAEELTQIEIAALKALRSASSVEVALSSFSCSGVDYGAERAAWVFAGDEPAEMLMPGARSYSRP